jgi:glycine/D-amino acid oxidase-like deaminating enzyme
MESERGYHAVVPAPLIELSMPILNESRYFCLCSMDDGLHISGTVEIAGLSASPNVTHAKTLAQQACELFLNLDSEEIYWMGHRPSFPDGLPMIGPVHGHPGLNLCFGHGHSGLTAAPQSGQLLAELMCNEQATVDPEPYFPGAVPEDQVIVNNMPRPPCASLSPNLCLALLARLGWRL